MNGDIGLGKLLKGEALRDAVHIAVAPVTAGCLLHPGQGVRFNGKTVIGHPMVSV